MNKILYLLPLLLLCSCHKKIDQTEAILSMQIRDRNGFSETISNKDRLKIYQNVDFLTGQPYEKVLRVYHKDPEGKSPSKLTSYHDNGGIWQYLEALDGRAHGKYLEWHENAVLKIDATIIEGLADLSQTAQSSWLFHEKCLVFDEEGNCIAKFNYDKGKLIDNAEYFYPSGKIQKRIPYTKGIVNGIVSRFDESGNLLEEIHYKNGIREGEARSYWEKDLIQSQEIFRNDLLIHGIYYDQDGHTEGEVIDGNGIRAKFIDNRLDSLTEYHNGKPEGQIQIFNENGQCLITYHVKEGKKNGEEWEYYPGEETTPKLFIHWHEDIMQGVVKTWYPNGKLESQREMSHNKKHGLSLGYYLSGDLMLMEEYDNDRLLKGSYYKKGETEPVSEIKDGEGIATFYTPEGYFLQKVSYEKGKPLID